MPEFMDRLLTGRAIIFEGNEPDEGPQSAILVGVHGDEVCGVRAAESIFPTLSIDRGRVWVVCGNPRAVKRNVRLTKENLNRMFKEDLTAAEEASYEHRRAEYLKSIIGRTDVLLDIHASYTPHSRRFAICEQNADPIVKKLPISLVVNGFDAVEPGGTDYYANLIGKVGICVECGYLKDPKSTEVAEGTILSFLAVRGHIAGAVKRHAQRRIQMYHLYYAKSAKCVLTRKFRDFEPITRGTLIARDHDGATEVSAPRDSVILFANKDVKKVGDEVFLLGEYVD
jgi:succinylglutamate desuccinylase